MMNFARSSKFNENPNEILAVAEPYLADLAEAYLTQQIAALSEGDQLLQKKDFSTIQNIGHKLRGNASLFGLPWIAEQGRALEKVASEGDAGTCKQLFEEMLRYLNHVRFVQPLEKPSSPPVESVL